MNKFLLKNVRYLNWFMMGSSLFFLSPHICSWYEILQRCINTMAATKALRTLLQELRFANPCACIKDSLAAHYILAQYKKFCTTDQQLCKARDEALFLGQTYLTYLSSVRKYNELHKEYRGRGERSVKETADMVGFKLPTDPE